MPSARPARPRRSAPTLPIPPSSASRSTVRLRRSPPSAPGAGTPTGIVTVSDGVDSCTATAAAGQCAITLDHGRQPHADRSLRRRPRLRRQQLGRRAAQRQPTQRRSPAPVPARSRPTRSRSRTRTRPRGRAPRSRTSPLQARPTGRSASPPSGSSRRSAVRRPPVGTAFKYMLDRAATVRFDFTQPSSGRKVGGKCVTPNKRNRSKPKCTRLRGSLTFAGHAGLNTVALQGLARRAPRSSRPASTRSSSPPSLLESARPSAKLRFTIAR